MKTPRYLIVADGDFGPMTSKTANSVIRYLPDRTVAGEREFESEVGHERGQVGQPHVLNVFLPVLLELPPGRAVRRPGGDRRPCTFLDRRHINRRQMDRRSRR